MSCSTDVQLFPMAVELRFILTKRFKLAEATFTTVLFRIVLSFLIITWWNLSKQLSCLPSCYFRSYINQNDVQLKYLTEEDKTNVQVSFNIHIMKLVEYNYLQIFFGLLILFGNEDLL